MSTPEQYWTEVSELALEFLATLASDEPDAVSDRPQALDRLMLELDDPAKLHTMFYCLVWIAQCMRDSASGDTEPGTWTFTLNTATGPIPVDEMEPGIRWVSRWLVACMNGDSGAAAALWFGTLSSEAESKECLSVLMPAMMSFLTSSVREFVRVGRPLVVQGRDIEERAKPTSNVALCPTCGPTTTGPHPRKPNVVRCTNCGEHL